MFDSDDSVAQQALKDIKELSADMRTQVLAVVKNRIKIGLIEGVEANRKIKVTLDLAEFFGEHAEDLNFLKSYLLVSKFVQ